MTPEDYVSYPLALALKKAGFDWECDHYYCAFDNEADVRFWSIHPAQSQNGLRTPKGTVAADAPSLAQAQKWLRDKRKIDIELQVWMVGDTREYRPYIMPPKKHDFIAHPPEMSYESALSAGIAAALELIEKEGE